MTKRYCILGGGGSFGLAVTRHLLEHASPEKVIGVGRNAEKRKCFTLGIGENDGRYRYHTYHVGHELDLLMEVLDREQPHVIINFAAQGESATSFAHSWRYFDTNCTALVRLVEQLGRRAWLERFIHIGTSELYGSPDHAAREDDPVSATSPYAISKAAFDLYLLAVHKHSGFPMNIVRPANCYGEGQQLHRIVPKCVLYGLTGRYIPLHGGGAAQKSYLHSADMARAVHLVSEQAPLGAVYNVGPDEPTAIRDVVAMTADALGMKFEDLAKVSGDRAHQDARYWLDSSAIKRDLNWSQQIGWREGLDRMVAWGHRYLDELRFLPTDFVMRG